MLDDSEKVVVEDQVAEVAKKAECSLSTVWRYRRNFNTVGRFNRNRIGRAITSLGFDWDVAREAS